jgi:hypothetical protein
MSYKKMSVCINAISIGAVFFLLYKAAGFQTDGAVAQTFFNGPRFYPMVLCIFFVIFSIASIISTLRKKEDRKVEFKNLRPCIIVTLLVIAWVVLWQLVGYFYIFGFIFVWLILYYLNPASASRRKLVITLIADIGIVLPIFLLFSIILKASI